MFLIKVEQFKTTTTNCIVREIGIFLPAKATIVMNYWLVKSEPFKYSWDQFVNEGKTMWDGVRNYAARNNLRDMKKGDHVFFYHSNEGLAIVGIAEVAKEAYQDPTTDDANWVVVDLKPYKAVPKPVTLDTLKTDPAFAEMDLVRLSRLSVGKVTGTEYKKILKMGGL
jgi:predicted RNA-binding protein with PUA-like domain